MRPEAFQLFFPLVVFLRGRAIGGVETLEWSAGHGREEEPGEAGRQEVTGDGPGDEERYAGRVDGVPDEPEGIEDAAARQNARRVYEEGEDAGDQARQ